MTMEDNTSENAKANAKAKHEPKEKAQKEKIITWMLVHAVLTASFGSGFQHGYNSGVVANPEKIIKDWMNQTLHSSEEKIDIIWSFTTSIVCIGGIVGGALISRLATTFGRRMTLIVNNGVAAVGAILMGTSKYVNAYWLLMVGRLVIGVNMGLNAGVSPMYLSEIAPMRIRGAVGSMYQLVITISILIGQGVSVEAALGNEKLWPILFYLIIIVAIYQAIALIFAPESPKYLLKNHYEDKAIKASVALCGERVGTENIELIKQEIAETENLPKVTIGDMFRVKKYRKALIIMGLLMAAQQLSGINAIIFYSTNIFKSAKLSNSASQYATVGLGIVNVLTTVASVYLVEKAGRKPLLAVGFGGMTIATTAFMICLFFVEKSEALAYVCIVLVYVYIILFAVGAGPIPWILGSELFATAARPMGLSIAVPINWLFQFLVTLLFPPLRNIMGPWVFIIFIVCNAAAFVYFLLCVPETKNKPIDVITQKFE